ncbi:subtilisin-like protease SBT5.6 [Arachis stenosperma]|uniref:subtilisin-like protease SBT5.6 n=1 Tax=Arachis stenosperma TaxID=217475 RepID=UPI0025AC18EF|nr:subtilisin-like protease SBT5.6 [Arachis stenosperma]
MLQDGTIIEGRSITPRHMPNSFYPLVLAREVEFPGIPISNSGFCLDKRLDRNKAKGKIVVCMRGEGGRIRKELEVERAGGVGFILGNNELLGNDLSSDVHFIPSTQVSYHNVLKLIHYINSSSNPMAYMLGLTRIML